MKTILLLFLSSLLLSWSLVHGDDGVVNINKGTNVLQLQKELETLFQNGNKYVNIIRDGDKKNKIKMPFSPWWMSDIPLKSLEQKEYVNGFRIVRVHFGCKHTILEKEQYGKNDLPKFKKYLGDKFQDNKLAFLLSMDKNVLVVDIWDYVKFLYDQYPKSIAIVRITDRE